MTFEETCEVDLKDFRGIVQSMSCAPLVEDPRYPAMQRALETFFSQWCEDGTLRWAEECTVETAQVE